MLGGGLGTPSQRRTIVRDPDWSFGRDRGKESEKKRAFLPIKILWDDLVVAFGICHALHSWDLDRRIGSGITVWGKGAFIWALSRSPLLASSRLPLVVMARRDERTRPLA